MPLFHAIFHRQIEGDESLLQLAQDRFRAATLGPEFYPNSPTALEREQSFHPQDPTASSTVHLPRNLQVFDPRSHDEILAFVSRCGSGVRGLVVHDQPEAGTQLLEYVRQTRSLDQRLRDQGPGPLVFIEYACGLEVAEFVALFEALRDCSRIGCCIDISHIGIRQCQRAYERTHPGVDVCKLKPNSPELQAHVEEVQEACQTALPAVLEAIKGVGRLGKPLHFHLHDGHPSSTFSIYGVSDHLSFFRQIPIPFTYQGENVLPTIYGPLGLERIITEAASTASRDLLSFTLEIHAPQERRELGEYRRFFRHWRDLTNAERMNHWVDVLLQSHRLLRDICRSLSLTANGVVPR